MAEWVPTRTVNTGGYHRIVAQAPGHGPIDITFLRDAWVTLSPYSTADPFSESTAQLTFPQLGVLDDLSSSELYWLKEDTLIDIWWVPAMPVPDFWDASLSSDTALWIDPLTGKPDIVCPAYTYGYADGVWHRFDTPRGTKVWEGFIASVGNTSQSGTTSLTADLQGCLFQADLTLAKPFFPTGPQTLESLFRSVFDHTTNPSLRTHPLQIEWPPDWTLVAPAYTGPNANIYSPNVRPGAKWIGYTTRDTGSWNRKLTDFLQNMLAVMIVKPGSGSTPGNQWTLRNAPEGDATYPAGRTPILLVRDRNDTPAWSIWAGTQGIDVDLTRDGTQKENVSYGTGTDIGGTTWDGSIVSADGSRTDYLPLAASPLVYPYDDNPALKSKSFLRETYVQYGTGFSEPDATATAQQTIQRDIDPGWTGTITLTVDPTPEISRWTIRAGFTFLLKGFAGLGETGLRLHVAGVDCDPQAGTVTLTCDTRYRDLLTLNEAIARTRDPMTPAKLLSLNKTSVTIQDIQAPWNYSSGSGYVPRSSLPFYNHMPSTDYFPYNEWVKENPPSKRPDYYVSCNAGDTLSLNRWAGPIQILMSEKGTIARSEFFAVDHDGNLLAVPFHVSLYYVNGISAVSMPQAGSVYSPFLPGAFDQIDPTTGEAPINQALIAQSSFVQGWGNLDQPAGYSPGLYTKGAKPTGLLIDDGSWTWDCTNGQNKAYNLLASGHGKGRETAAAVSLYAMFYANTRSAEIPGTRALAHQKVYFGGRLYRAQPGSDS